MVRIPQDDLGLGILLEVLGVHAFDRAGSTHRHKDGCLYGAVVGLKGSGSCGTFIVRM
mgnify:CR=1 FL=1